MVIPGVSSYPGTSGRDSLHNASTHGTPSRAASCFQLAHWFFKTIIGKLAHNDSANDREARDLSGRCLRSRDHLLGNLKLEDLTHDNSDNDDQARTDSWQKTRSPPTLS